MAGRPAYVITLNRPLFNGIHHDSHGNEFHTYERFAVTITQPTEGIEIEIGNTELDQWVMEKEQKSSAYSEYKGELVVTMPWDRLTSLKSGVSTFMKVELTDWGNVKTTALFNITFPSP